MFSLLGWDNYHVAHPALITMFGATPGMTEAELIDFVAEKRQRANTHEEEQPDGSIIIRSAKTIKRLKRDKLFFLARVLVNRALAALSVLWIIPSTLPCFLPSRRTKKNFKKNKLPR